MALRNTVMDLHVPVNLLGLPVAAQQTTQDPHAAHPAQLLRHTGVGCTLSLTCGDQLDRSAMFPQIQFVNLLAKSPARVRTVLNSPIPMCLPLRRASVFLRQRAREWTVTGLRMMRPSFTSLRIC